MRHRYHLDQRVFVDFFGTGEELSGEIDAIDHKDDPRHPYRVWYDTPRVDEDSRGPVEVECEWVSSAQLRPAPRRKGSARS